MRAHNGASSRTGKALAQSQRQSWCQDRQTPHPKLKLIQPPVGRQHIAEPISTVTRDPGVAIPVAGVDAAMRGRCIAGRPAGARPLIAGRQRRCVSHPRIAVVPRAARAPASRLSERELAELAEENAKLRDLLGSHGGRLPPEQAAALRAQYDDLRALAAANGLELEPLPHGAGGEGEDGEGEDVGAAAAAAAQEAAAAAGGAGQQRAGAAADDDDSWIDERGRYGGEDADRLAPTLSASEQAARAAREAALRADAAALVAGHDPSAAAAERHHWLIFTVPEVPVAGSEVVVYFNKAQSATLTWAQQLRVQVGFNQWRLGGEKLALAPAGVAPVDGSDFWSVKVAVPEEAYEVNMVFGDDYGSHDNNAGQDFTFATEGGWSFEQWVDGAADRAAKAEEEEAAARAAAAVEAAAAAKAAGLARDEQEGADAVEELRRSYGSYREGALAARKVEASGAAVPLWATAPSPLAPGAKGVVRYNSKAGPLAWLDPGQGHAPPSLTYGFNNWRSKGDAPLEMKPAPKGGEASEGELWWEAEVAVPADAASLSFCVNSGDCWDNNGGADHKALVSLPAEYEAEADPVAAWTAAMLPELVAAARSRREAAEAAAAAKAAKREAERVILRANAMAVLRRQLKHVMFTEPEVPRAGEKVTVYYSPASTSLAGRDQLYVTAGFNRWGHLRKLGPAPMKAPGDGGLHHRATFMVPRDAHMIDLVFSDVQGGEGTYDNRGGLDYHIPVEGGVGAKPQPLHVVHIAVEMAPIAKVGGLGDVVTSLGRAVQDQGHMVEVILPWYQFFNASPLLGGRQFEAEFDWGGTRVVVTSCTVEGIRVFFVDPRNGFFATDSVYGRYDDEVRFDFFSKAALEFLLQTGRQPDILHCHDWQTAHVAKAYWDDYHNFGLWKPKVVFTIHNMNYGQKKIGEAAYYAQKFTTVSPSYAYEVGGHPAIGGHAHKFMGILNGIDPEIWDPMEDAWLPLPYSADNCEAGKAAARSELRRRLNMCATDDRIIVAVVSRLTGQKGVPLIKHAAWRARDRGGQFVLLGSAPDPKVQGEFNALAAELGGGHENNAAFVFSFDEPLSHLIYAAADVVVVPSMFEPCGLSQMIAMRYGAVPVVRHTGGLRDTVFDVDTDKPRAAWEVAGSSDADTDGPGCTNGFAFEGTDAGALDYALNRAVDAFYNDKPWFRSLQARVMTMDWSWNRPALQYIDLYYAATKN
ncbi:MAG: hypothetical protein J3K34DRAFT_517637 [Monoraphidium minutum]|nr:MAG: hypothetical protein J3K34DRAFT_517637 [Monoraphidium minutum]